MSVYLPPSSNLFMAFNFQLDVLSLPLYVGCVNATVLSVVLSCIKMNVSVCGVARVEVRHTLHVIVD